MATSVAQAEAQYERLPLPLGVSLPPGDAHALSVSMPAWEDVVGYEEARPEVIDAMACGYPRFFRHPFVKQLEAELKRSFAPFQQLIGAWNLMVVPTEDVAKRLHAFLSTQDDVSQADRDSAAVHSVRDGLAWVVIFHDALTLLANRFWQHTGEIVSSRHAERLLELLKTDARGHQIVKMHGTPGHAALRERVAGLYFGKTNAAANARNVAVYPTGMGGIFAALRLLTQFQKDAKAILFGFPYLDTLKLLQRTQWCPAGVHFFPVSGEKELMAVEEILKKEKILAIFTEFPSNPLLSLPDLDKLAALAHEHGTYLVVDDTVGSYNTNALKNGTADIVCTSLAKIFSGTCNVMAGSVVLNPQGASYDAFLEHLTSTSDSFLVEEDAEALNEASVDLEERIARVNASTSVLVKRLQSHKAVKALYYPELGSTADVELFRRYASSIYSGTEQPSFGPLFSVVLHGGEQAVRAFYDTMKVAKGPSLGTNFTLACPYTVIAHYYELDYVESCGVDRNLVRISIGLEDPETLWATLQDALGAAESVLHRQQQ